MPLVGSFWSRLLVAYALGLAGMCALLWLAALWFADSPGLFLGSLALGAWSVPALGAVLVGEWSRSRAIALIQQTSVALLTVGGTLAVFRLGQSALQAERLHASSGLGGPVLGLRLYALAAALLVATALTVTLPLGLPRRRLAAGAIALAALGAGVAGAGAGVRAQPAGCSAFQFDRGVWERARAAGTPLGIYSDVDRVSHALVTCHTLAGRSRAQVTALLGGHLGALEVRYRRGRVVGVDIQQPDRDD